MSLGEVSSIGSKVSYQGQGSSVKTTPASVEAPSTGSKTDVSKNDKAVTSSANIVADKAENDGTLSVTEQESKQASSALKEAVSKINNAAGSNCEAVFGIHEGTNRVMIKMVDKSSKEVIKEFPAEETLDLIAKAWELAGIMVDERR